jgi:hypothetical protein
MWLSLNKQISMLPDSPPELHSAALPFHAFSNIYVAVPLPFSWSDINSHFNCCAVRTQLMTEYLDSLRVSSWHEDTQCGCPFQKVILHQE